MNINKLNNILDKFTNNKKVKTLSNEKEQEVCDSQTGECYIITSRDGIVEKLDKKFITEDGRQLLQD